MNSKRKAFTMIEIVVALAIILILVGLITVATTKVLDSSRGSSTKTFLQTGVSLFEEWRKINKSGYPTCAWPLVSNVDGVDQRVVPYDLKPGSADLQGIGVGLTRGTMHRFAAHPAVKRMTANMPQDRWIALPGITPAADKDSLPPTLNIGQQFWGVYSQKAAATGARYFICYNGPSGDAALNAPDDTDPTAWPADWREFWMETAPGNINVMTDGWNNPVLFIPACGFEARDINGNIILVTSDGVKTNNQFHPTGASFLDRLSWSSTKSYTQGQIVMSRLTGSPSQWGLFTCSANHTATSSNKPDTAQGRKYWDRTPVDPFFASAGPDGIFFDPNEPDTLLDNLYSFER